MSSAILDYQDALRKDGTRLKTYKSFCFKLREPQEVRKPC